MDPPFPVMCAGRLKKHRVRFHGLQDFSPADKSS